VLKRLGGSVKPAEKGKKVFASFFKKKRFLTLSIAQAVLF
jgi:hypothetical protein